MEDKITIMEVSLIMLLKRIEEMKIPGQVNYEIERMVNEIQKKIYDVSDLLEEIEALEES